MCMQQPAGRSTGHRPGPALGGGQLVSPTDPSIPSDSDNDFYASIPLREKLNQRWLSEQLGILDGTLAHFPWGTTGVARDKSENVFIYLHNRHNSWVFGD